MSLLHRYARKIATLTQSPSFNLVEVEEAKAFTHRCVEQSGATAEHAASLADVLVAADQRGHYSHGLNRLETYCKQLAIRQCDGTATPVILRETCATAHVDGRNGIGMVSAVRRGVFW